MTSKLSRHPSLYEMVYDIIKEKIINGELAPGFRLKEEFLVNLLGTSKTPIKLALAKLEQDGLVKTVPRRGTHVIKLSVKNIQEIYSLREVLEGLAARMAAQKISAKNLTGLAKILTRMQKNSGTTNSSLKGYLVLDNKFHDGIIAASKHQLLQESLKPLLNRIAIFKLRSAVVSERREKAIREHLVIFDALEQGDPELAEKSMRRHLQNAMVEMLKDIA